MFYLLITNATFRKADRMLHFLSSDKTVWNSLFYHLRDPAVDSE